jgi:uncharacterized phage-like protein YoqJ
MGLFKKNNNQLDYSKESTACFTGHRPKSLPWGYDETKESCIKFKAELKKVLTGAIEYGITHFISGLALGIDMICAETIIELKHQFKNITLEGAIPCPNQDERWNAESKKRYAKLKKECDSIHIVCPEYSDDCMNIRNKYMVDKSSVVIAIWNGKPSGTGNTVRFAKENGCKIRIINPNDFK